MAQQSTSHHASVRRCQRALATAEDGPREELWTLILHLSSCQVDPKDHSFHKHQVILGKQLFQDGATSNLDAWLPLGRPYALARCMPHELDDQPGFRQLLMEKGASPNVQDRNGYTPLICITFFATGAAKFLLEWSPPPPPPTTDIDINITNQAGLTALGLIRSEVHGGPINLQVKHAFFIQQWREIEKMLVERGSR